MKRSIRNKAQFSMTCSETLARCNGGPDGTVTNGSIIASFCRLFLDACRDSRQVAVPVVEWPSTDLKDFGIDTPLALGQAKSIKIAETFVASG